MGRYLVAWLPMVVLAVVNGTMRDAWLLPALGAPLARQVSTLILLALLTAYIAVVLARWPPASARQAAAVGALWLVLTVAFELALGRLVSGLSWQAIVAEYDLAAGRLWALVPLWVAVAPLVFHRLRTRLLTTPRS